MRFWDSSAIVPLFLDEPGSARVRKVYESDRSILVWWATEIECANAIARREREALLDPRVASAARKRLDGIRGSWHEVEPTARVREIALRLIRVHSLRTGDALQLAAAHVGSGDRPTTLEFVCLDDRLALAAEREGFQAIGPV